MIIDMAQPLVMAKREPLESPLLWYVYQGNRDLLLHAIHSGYTGVVLPLAAFLESPEMVPERMELAIQVSEGESLEPLSDFSSRKVIVASAEIAVLEAAGKAGFRTALRAYVDDAASLHFAIDVGQRHDFLIMAFRDPTNIPLELVIASLQRSKTILIKEIAENDVDDAVVTFGVMEVGADGIAFSPTSADAMAEFFRRKELVRQNLLPLEVGEVIESRPIGMGYRSCVDLTTLFTPTEGMLVGSTSQGGIFCCPEVFHLPYMELRPFRVNAGAVHSYVFNLHQRTDYMTELRAGSPVMVLDSTGRTRRAFVGRVKTEVRPLRLIEAKFSGDRRVNILLQDDWHVRVYSDEAKPRNITELKPGDRVLGHVTDPGRHVGIKVSEHILES